MKKTQIPESFLLKNHEFVPESFWRKITNYDPSERLLLLYLLTNPKRKHSTIYPISLKITAIDIGINDKIVEKMIRKFDADGLTCYANGQINIGNLV